MLKLEIKMDDVKISREHQYSIDSIYRTLEQTFDQYHLRKENEPDGTVVFYGSGHPKDYGAFGYIITSLKDKAWFMNYVTKWIWYNSDDSENEEDFSVEDVLHHYTKKASAT